MLREKVRRGGRMRRVVVNFLQCEAWAHEPPHLPAPRPCRQKKSGTPTSRTQQQKKNPTMPPYDSESSDEGGDYAETNVLLGYATREATGDAVSHLGGAPVSLV